MADGVTIRGMTGLPAPLARAQFKYAGREYLLAGYQSQSGWQWPLLDANMTGMLMRRALATDATLATRLRGRFASLDGGRAITPRAEPDQLADRIASLVGSRRLALFDMGPPVMLNDSIAEGPAAQLLAEQTFADKARQVVTGLADVDSSKWGNDAKAAFKALKDQMTSSPALITTMIFVFAMWIASHATGVIGLVLDAALFGIAIYKLGMSAFDWFDRLAGLIGDIDKAQSPSDLKRCSGDLAKLIVEIGVGVFVTLLTRAAGKAVKAGGKAVADKLKTAPPKAAPPVKPAQPAAAPDPKPAAKPATKPVPANKNPTYKRPSGYRKGVRDEVWEKAKNKDGKVIDPLTGKEMQKSDPWDMGHKDGYEFRKHQKSAADRGISRKQFLDEHNNPSHYRPELPSSNQSHKGENLTDDYFGD